MTPVTFMRPGPRRSYAPRHGPAPKDSWRLHGHIEDGRRLAARRRTAVEHEVDPFLEIREHARGCRRRCEAVRVRARRRHGHAERLDQAARDRMRRDAKPERSAPRRDVRGYVGAGAEHERERTGPVAP